MQAEHFQIGGTPGGSSGSMDPFVVPDIPPFPDPFYGQFIQLDVLSVTPQG